LISGARHVPGVEGTSRWRTGRSARHDPDGWRTERSYRGYCICLLKEHRERLHELPPERQLRLYDDVARVAAAIACELRPLRVNYPVSGTRWRTCTGT